MTDSTDKPQTDLYGHEVSKQTSSPSEEAYTKEQWEGATSSGKHTSLYETKYGLARGMASFFVLIGWLVVAAGIVSGLISIQQTGVNVLFGFLLAGSVSITGLVMVMLALIVMATLDNADHTGEMLALMKSRK